MQDRKVASTLAAEANGASMAYDRSMYVRAMCAEIEQPFPTSATPGKLDSWEDICAQVPCASEQTANHCMILASSPRAR